VNTHIFYLGNTLDVLRTLPDESVHCCVTSPPYWGLRDYGVPGQIGLEPTPEEYVEKMVEVFREVRRVLRDDGTLWLNLGDSYNGSSGSGGKTAKQVTNAGSFHDAGVRMAPGLKPKDLVGIPWRVAFALQADGWWLRSDIIWAKPAPMPEPVTDRPTRSHEYIFLLTKSQRYFYDHVAIQEESVTQDLRRPYGSEGAWQLDGRPQEQRHGGELRKFGGNKYPGNVRRTYSGNAYTPTGKRNKRDVWTVATQPFPGAHFAVMPEALVEPCILAGTSPQACPTCRAPWERVVERIAGASKECPKTQAAHEARGGTGKPSGTVGKSGGGRIDSISRTIGWRPTCSCRGNDGSGRCIVLDPFGGSGTVSVVAQKLGRSSIYIDLNPTYRQMAIDRMRPEQPSLVQPFEIVLKEVAS